MRPARVAVMAAAGFMLGWVGSGPVATAPYSPSPVRARVAATTTTSALPPITTPARVVPSIRVSRSITRPRPTAGGVEQWRAVACVYEWPCDMALRVMGCESGGRADAYNYRSGATGLFQILHGPFDPVLNIDGAHRMWLSRGWQPWNASRRCWS